MSETDEISTEPGAGATTSPPPASSGRSSPPSPSRALLLLKTAHVVGASALTGWNIPFAQEMYRAGDWKPIAAVAAVAVLIATRAGFADVWAAVRGLIPFGKKDQ